MPPNERPIFPVPEADAVNWQFPCRYFRPWHPRRPAEPAPHNAPVCLVSLAVLDPAPPEIKLSSRPKRQRRADRASLLDRLLSPPSQPASPPFRWAALLAGTPSTLAGARLALSGQPAFEAGPGGRTVAPAAAPGN